ncbi:MAG: DUF4058 family protein [Planctomycetes bacterium]|nr:DUF4058 family protein [Planctomycetota bacterium]
MPIHDWSKVEAGIFHDFHGDWIQVIKHTLNNGILPPEYYALSEQKAAGVGPDILTLADKSTDESPSSGGTGLLVAKPKARIVETTDNTFYTRKQRHITVRHVTDDRVVAVIEIVSPGNKNKHGIRSFLDKVKDLLKNKIHLLVIDLQPPGKHDPNGIHAAIWDTVWYGSDAEQTEKPLTVASYECNDQITAYVEPVAVGDVLPDSPLYLVPDGYVLVPLEKTYIAAWEGVPRRWRSVIDPAS